MDSYVSSLTSSLNQLDMNRHAGIDAINRLPDEIMQLILVKLKLDGDIRKLIRLRLVSTRWCALVEDYCRLKKSLLVELRYEEISPSFTFYPHKERYFRLANVQDFGLLFLSTKMPSVHLSSLLEIFPNIVQLSVDFLEPARVRNFVTYLNSLDSLKQLDFAGPLALSTISALSPTLSKLVHLSVNSSQDAPLLDAHYAQLVSHLGPSCARLYFAPPQFVHHHIGHWHNVNPHWLVNLTHLYVQIEHYSDQVPAQIVHYLSEHATLLKVLNINLVWCRLVVTPTVIRDLAKLANLTELLLCVKMDFEELEQTVGDKRRFKSLSSVLDCKLSVQAVGPRINGQLCTRVMSAIFPNLIHLDMSINRRQVIDFEDPRQLQRQIVQHLDRFPKLRNRRIFVN